VKRYLLLLFLLLPSFFLQAQNIMIDNIISTNDKLYISAHLTGNFPEDIYTYLENGMKITLVFHVEVFDKKPFYLNFFNKSVVIKTVKKIATYNLWEKTYYIKEDKKILKFNSRNDFFKSVSKITNVFLLSNSELKKLEHPVVKISSELESIKLFPPLSWIFDLVSVREFKTDWVEKELK